MRANALWLALAATLAACDASSITHETDRDGGGKLPDARGPDANGCEGAYGCPDPDVCSPTTHRCGASLACATHSDCGKQGYCASGSCARSVLGGPCDTTDNCAGQELCVGGHCGCGGEVLTATAVAPNMLIALDRSDSMVTNDVPPSNDSRWTVAKRALEQLTSAYQERIRFGLVVWPGAQKMCEGSSPQTTCKGMAVAVAPATRTATAIGDYLATTTCGLSTPIGGTLAQLVGYAGLGDGARDNYVVLVTDGEERCDGDGEAGATALAMRTPHVKTFVIGFGGDVNGTLLSAIAVAGGTARPTSPSYYQADDEGALADAFAAISGSIVSCTYTLSSEPDVPDRLRVYVGDTNVARNRDHTSGWDYDTAPKRLTFYGPTCALLQSGGAGALVVTFGCPVLP